MLSQMLLYEDPKVFVFNKPAGLAVQGGSGIARHMDSMLEAWRNKRGEKPRLVHRLDRETSGVLVVARRRGAAQALTAAFRERTTKKTYWALVKGVPTPHEGKISTWLVKDQTPDGDRMRVCRHGEPDADHAVSYYRVIEQAGQNLTWVEMEPYTGRTHQLRVQAAYKGCPILGDSKYFEADHNWQFPGGIQKRLHLHARHISIPAPGGGRIEATAPLPPHMVQSWNLLELPGGSGNVKLVLFDCDGTLVDSAANIHTCMEKTFIEAGFPAPDLSLTKSVIGLTLDAAISQMLQTTIDQRIHQMAARYKHHSVLLRSASVFRRALFDGIQEVLNTLIEEDKILVGVVTGKSRRGLDTIIRNHDLETGIIASRTADECPSKPHPAMVLECCAETGVDPAQTVVIGDAIYDMQMARAAGAGAIGVSWGHAGIAELVEAGAHHVVHEADALLPLVME